MDFLGSGAATGAAVGAVVAATLNALAVKYLLPRYLKELDEFRENVHARLNEIEKTGPVELGKLRERDDGLRQEMERKDYMLRELWHQESNRLGVSVGTAMTHAEQNTKSLADLIEQVRDNQDRADDRHERLKDEIHLLDKTVATLSGAVQGLTASVAGMTTTIGSLATLIDKDIKSRVAS